MPQISAATTLASDTVDLVGVEPTTSSVQEKRSPIGTTDPFLVDTGQNRTDILPSAIRELYHLSYRPMFGGF